MTLNQINVSEVETLCISFNLYKIYVHSSPQNQPPPASRHTHQKSSFYLGFFLFISRAYTVIYHCHHIVERFDQSTAEIHSLTA